MAKVLSILVFLVVGGCTGKATDDDLAVGGGGAPDESPQDGDSGAGGDPTSHGGASSSEVGGAGGFEDGTASDSAGSGGQGGSSGPSGQTIRLATFNIQVFGQTKLGRPEVVSELVTIVRQYPFVAVQEIKDVEQVVPYNFLEQLNQEGASYAMQLSPRTGQQPDDSPQEKEQYAFYYDTSRLEPLGDGLLFDDNAGNFFAREPYAAQFQTTGGFTFVAITIHTQPDAAVQEIDHLHDVMVWASGTFPDEDDFILLGDLNADCSYASPTELDLLSIRSSDYFWIIPDDADTNLAMTECSYDRIVVTSGTTTNYAGTWGVDQAFTNTMISDHWLVWAEFWSDER